MTVHTIAVLCLTLMTGNEICVAAFVNPVLRKLPEHEQVPFLSRAAAQLGFTMPFWYIASFALTVATAIAGRHATGVWPAGSLAAVFLQVVILVITIGFMVPINNLLGKLQPDDRGWTSKAVR